MDTPPTPTSTFGGEHELLAEALRVLPAIAVRVGRAAGLGSDASEDLASLARLRLLEGSDQALRNFRGDSSLATYLTVMVSRIALDEKVRQAGRWRPSAGARRDGPVAEELERLVARDGVGRNSAFEILLGRFPGLTRQDLETIEGKLRYSTPRRFVPVEPLADTLSRSSDPERDLVSRERENRRQRAIGALKTNVSSLPAEDRAILRLRFEQGASVVEIARLLATEPRLLYTRIQRLLASLRKGLVDGGFSADLVEETLDPVVTNVHQGGINAGLG